MPVLFDTQQLCSGKPFTCLCLTVEMPQTRRNVGPQREASWLIAAGDSKARSEAAKTNLPRVAGPLQNCDVVA